MSSPKVTVLMPVYNGEKFLRQAIDSVLSQTYKDFELLIINDGSTDHSREIILSYTDPRITLSDNPENLGRPRSRNIGLKLARGEYIAIMDADDIALPQRLEKQLTFLSTHPEVGVVASWIEKIDEQGRSLGFWRTDKNNNTPEEIFYTLHFRNCIAHSSILFNKELVLKLGGYNEDFAYSQDYELLLRISKIAKIAKIKEVLVKWRDTLLPQSAPKRQAQRAYGERLFLENFSELLNRYDKETLLSFKKYILGGKASASFGKMLLMLNYLNHQIIRKANPVHVDMGKLKKYCRVRRNHHIFNLLKSKTISLLS